MGDLGRKQNTAEADAERDATWSGFLPILHRFFFFGWIFKDMTQTMNVFERHAAWAYNQSQRHWLPVYMRRWLVISVLLGCTGSYCQAVWAATAVAQACYLGMTGSVAVLMTLLVDWLFLAKND